MDGSFINKASKEFDKKNSYGLLSTDILSDNIKNYFICKNLEKNLRSNFSRRQISQEEEKIKKFQHDVATAVVDDDVEQNC